MPGSASVTASTARPPTSTTRSPTSFACSTMPPATRFTRASGDCDRRLPPDRDDPERLAAPPDERFVADPLEDEPLRALLRDDPLRLAPDFRAEPLLLAEPPRELEPLFDAEPRLAAEPRRVALPDDVLRAELLFRAEPLLRAAPPLLRAAPLVRDDDDLRADVFRALDPERLPVFAAPLRLLLALFAPLRAPLLLADFDRLPAPPDPLRFRAVPPDLALPPLLPDRPLFAVLRLRADFDAVAMCVLPVGGVCVAVQDSRTACFAQ